MASLTMEASGPRQRRRAFFIHRIQKAYALWIWVLLFVYSSLFFTLAFLGPYLQPVTTLYSAQAPLTEREYAANKLLLLSETLWVAVPILFLGAVVFSLILTRRVAGPLYRLELSTEEWANGNLSWRIKFRKTDQLDDLADSANQAVQRIEDACVTIRDRNRSAQAALVRLSESFQRGSAPSDAAKQLNEALAVTREIDAVLSQFDMKPTLQN